LEDTATAGSGRHLLGVDQAQMLGVDQAQITGARYAPLNA
jgi:hypothetical protein